MISQSHLTFIHLVLIAVTLTKSEDTWRFNYKEFWDKSIREFNKEKFEGDNVRHHHSKRAKDTPTLAPSISFHDLAVLSRGERPNPLEKSIGAIFSKVAFAPHVARYEEVLTSSTTPLSTTQAFLPKFVTPKLGIDLDKWGFSGFKPKDPFIIERTTLSSIRSITRSLVTTPKTTVMIKTSTTSSSTITSSLNMPTTPPVTEKPLMRINVPKPVHIKDKNEIKDIDESIYDQINNSKDLPLQPPQVLEDINEDTIDSREASFQVHIYTVIILYALLGVYSIAAFFQLAASLDYIGLLPRAASVGIILFMLSLAVVRLAHLLHDPYTVEKKLPPYGALLLFDAGFPCLSSALSLLIWSLMQTTELQIMPKRLQNFTSLVVILAVHYTFLFAADIFGVTANIPALYLANQALFILWMLTLCLGYFAAFGPISKASKELEIELEHYATARTIAVSGLVVATRGTLAVSVVSLGLVATQLCSLFSSFSIPWNIQEDVFQRDNYWSWWTFQLISRFIEISAGTLLVTIVSQPQKWRVKKPDSSPNNASDVYSRKIVDFNYQGSCGSCRGLKPCGVRTKEYIVVPVTERSFGSSTNSSVIPPSVTYECTYGCAAYQRPHDRVDQQYESIDEISKTVRYKNNCGLYGDKVHLHGTGRCHACEVAYKYQTGELTYANERSPTENPNIHKQLTERVLMDNYAKFLVAAQSEHKVNRNNLTVPDNIQKDSKNGPRGLLHAVHQGGSPQFSFDSSCSSDGKSLISNSSSSDSMCHKPGGEQSVRIEFV